MMNDGEEQPESCRGSGMASLGSQRRTDVAFLRLQQCEFCLRFVILGHFALGTVQLRCRYENIALCGSTNFPIELDSLPLIFGLTA